MLLLAAGAVFAQDPPAAADVAKASRSQASDVSSFVTGTELGVDGGFTAV